MEYRGSVRCCGCVAAHLPNFGARRSFHIGQYDMSCVLICNCVANMFMVEVLLLMLLLFAALLDKRCKKTKQKPKQTKKQNKTQTKQLFFYRVFSSLSVHHLYNPDNTAGIQAVVSKSGLNGTRLHKWSVSKQQAA